MLGRVDLPSLRAALWTYRALRSARRQLRRTGLDGLSLPRLPRLAPSAGRGVRAILRRQPHTCLERALVLQRWRAAHGEPRDVVVGVRGPSATFQAHAWLEDEEPVANESFAELLRVRP
jgi:transglutaminase superfamily protein